MREDFGSLFLHPLYRGLGCSRSSASASRVTASCPLSQPQGSVDRPTFAEHAALSLVSIHSHSLLSSGQAVGQQSWRLWVFC